MLELNKIYCGDSLELMKSIPDKSIDLVVTSPPYDNLRTYEGFTFDFEGMAKELFRIMKTGGVVVWVVADATINGSETGTSFRQALYFMETGFRLHDTMIWEKSAFTATGALAVRYAQVFEYMFIFSIENLKTFNPIKDRKTNGIREKSGTVRNTDGTTKKQSSIGKMYGHLPAQRYNVWRINSETSNTIRQNHPARFPIEIPRDHILSWSNPDDIVLDIFNGSGTTCLAAEMLGRKWIGIDISQKYCDIAEKRIDQYRRQGKLDL